MTFSIEVLIAALASVAVGFGVGFAIRKVSAGKKLAAAEARAAELIRDAETQAKTIRKEAELEARDLQLKAKAESDREVQEKQRELQQVERRLQSKEDTLDKKFELITQRERELQAQEQSLADRRKHVEGQERKAQELVEQMRVQLERVAGLSAEEAKKQLHDSLIDDVKKDAAREVQMILQQAKDDAASKAQYITALAIERLGSTFAAERAVSTVPLPNDEMKGRIIGREGRNIRAFEAATGIDVVIDDTPGAVILSGFNPIRREVARIALERLLADGRIHPARIEELVAAATKEVEATMVESAQKACLELNIGTLHPELLKLMGALRYRYSYAQNVLAHSVEMAHIAGMIAAQIGFNQTKAKRAAFLHDIGKAVTHEVEGSHALIGMEFCKKYGEPEDVCHAVGAHHEDIPQETVLDLIVDAADAISGARPGARSEVLEAYVKRLEDLERITKSFKGVDSSFAIQAGREIRVMVQSEIVNDADAAVLSRDIAKKIEAEMTYPGQIKVTVIRETRATEYAK